MTLRAQSNFDAGAIKEKVKRLRGRLRSISKNDNVEAGKLREIIDDYYELVEKLGIPRFDLTQLDRRETATFQKLNRIFTDVDEDINALFQEYAGILTMVQQSYNRSQALLAGTEGELKNATAQTLTAAIEGGLVQRGTFVAVEDFADDSKTLPSSTAEIGFGGAALTLQKTSINPVDHAGSELQVAADDRNPYTDERVDEIAANRPGEEAIQKPSIRTPYEGRYYAYLGEAEFEGGRLKLIPAGDGFAPAETPEELKVRSRRVMFDGDPDTYHQVERTISNNGNLLDPGQLDNDFPYDLEVEYTLETGGLTRATGVVLDPINFGERAWIEVRSMETSVDGQTWEPIPGLHDYNYFNVLTDEANKTLTEDQVDSLLAPSKYDYGGRGVWLFGQREFKFLRFRVLQRTPIQQPYEVLRVKQQRTVKKTKKAKKVFGIKLGKDKSKTKTEKRSIELSYEESLKAYSGESVLDEDLGSYRSDQGLDISFAGHNLYSGGGTTVEKSGWSTTAQDTVVKDDVVRYVVGIRELEILSATYTPESLYVSRPFKIASPVRQISFRADHAIPDSFGDGQWVKYSVSVDGGNTWQRIAPIDAPAQFEGTQRIPTVVQVNSRVPEEAKDDRFGYLDVGTPVREVQVRIELSRPADQEGASPVVKRYALEILTQETTDRII